MYYDQFCRGVSGASALVGGRSGRRFLGFGRNLLLVLLLLPANVGILVFATIRLVRLEGLVVEFLLFSLLAIDFVAGLRVQVRDCVIERLGINSIPARVRGASGRRVDQELLSELYF